MLLRHFEGKKKFQLKAKSNELKKKDKLERERTVIRLNIHFHNEQRKTWKCALRQLEMIINIKMTNHLFVGKTVSEDMTMGKKCIDCPVFSVTIRDNNMFGHSAFDTVLLNIFIRSRFQAPICLFPNENFNCLRKLNQGSS